MLLQAPAPARKLGLFASARVMPETFSGSRDLQSIAVIEASYALQFHVARQGTPQVKSALLQQMTESGLLQCLDQLAEALVQQLEQCSAAGAAARTHRGESKVLQHWASRLLIFQVGLLALLWARDALTQSMS